MKTPSRGFSVAAGSGLVFTTSAVVLVLEILAGRMLAPYVGVRLETYTGVIGVILAGISAGSWFGGRLADRKDPGTVLGALIVAGGMASLAIPLLLEAVGPLVSPDPLGIVTVALAAFFAPAFLLSGVTPAVAKLQLLHLESAGSTVGRLSAISSGGAIFGTFVSGFFLVSALPTRKTVLTVGVCLVALGAAISLRWRTWATVVILALVTAGASLPVRGPCERESAYFCLRVEASETGRTLVLDDLPHSFVDLQDPRHLKFTYIQAFASVIDAHAATPTPLRVLHIGGGGFTMPRYLAATRPGARSVVLELDRRVVEIGKDRLGLRTSPDLRVKIGDARILLRGELSGAYDVVIGDAYASLSVPWHLTTTEFLQGVRRVLKPGGVYVANLIDYPPMRFVRAETATLLATFDQVAGVAPQPILDGSAGGNYVLVASQRPIDADAIRAQLATHSEPQGVATRDVMRRFSAGAPLLRDDFAPVDQMLAQR